MKKLTELPETWHIIITEENREIVKEWFKDRGSYLYDIGCAYGIIKNNREARVKSRINELGSEITTEDFKRLVLAKELTEKKFEYKVKDEKYNLAIEKLCTEMDAPYEKYEGQNIHEEKYVIKLLSTLNVLDLFFDKVEVKDLPMINGVKSYEFEDVLMIGGDPIDAEFFKHNFKSYTSDNGTYISEEKVKQIREYLNK